MPTKVIDIPLGTVFGSWVTVSNTFKKGITYVTCRCSCGVLRDVRASALIHGKTHGCGCNKDCRRVYVSPGERFFRWVVLKPILEKRRTLFLCRCDCGVEKEVPLYSLKRGISKSCGCYARELAKVKATKHDAVKQNVMSVYSNMIARCCDVTHKAYNRYGGRGITVCDEWRNISNFIRDMCPRPKGYQLDRVDNNGNYCKENCRWVLPIDNMHNTRSNRNITFKGKTKCLSQWARDLNMPLGTLSKRLKLGWDIERALS
jgi:hypothetical protein